jgi:hypothetical protein
MRSELRGKPTSRVEVGNISPHGLWLLMGTREMFLPFDQFPWFRDAPIGKVFHVEQPHAGHLYWPELDIDLSVESIEHPDRFPLISRARPDSPSPPASPRRSTKSKRVSRPRPRG